MTPEVIPLRALIRVPLFLACCTLLLVLAASVSKGPPGPLQELMIGSVAGFGTFALTMLIVRWEGLRLCDVGAMPNAHSLSRLIFGFAVGLFLIASHSMLVGVTGHVRWIRTAGPTVHQFGLAVIGFLLLAAREELAFHGYPLRRLQMLVGVWGAQAAIAVVFALEHIAGGWSVSQALWGAGMGSVLFGMASIATRGLAVPIGIHAAWNVGDWLRGNRGEGGLWRPDIEDGFSDTASWSGIGWYAALMTVATIGFWFWHRVRGPARQRLSL